MASCRSPIQTGRHSLCSLVWYDCRVAPHSGWCVWQTRPRARARGQFTQRRAIRLVSRTGVTSTGRSAGSSSSRISERDTHTETQRAERRRPAPAFFGPPAKGKQGPSCGAVSTFSPPLNVAGQEGMASSDKAKSDPESYRWIIFWPGEHVSRLHLLFWSFLRWTRLLHCLLSLTSEGALSQHHPTTL